jgi:hypothetical protein
MGNVESKLAYKNKVFRLAGADDDDDLNDLVASDDPYWKMFWEVPNTAEEVFALLTYNDLKAIRENNKANFLNLVRVIAQKLIKTSKLKTFPDAQSKKEVLNCIRVLTRVMPFVFEMVEVWEKEINHLFWSLSFNPSDKDSWIGTGSATVGSFSSDSRGLSSLESSSVKVNINQNVNNSPNSTRVNIGQTGAGHCLGQMLIHTLVDLLFTREFTLDSTGVKGTDFKMWEVGIGYNGKYSVPSPGLDSNRLEVLRLLLTLTSQTLYLNPKNVVSQGSRFFTVLVVTLQRMKSLTLICSLLNVVCRSCKTDTENNGLTYNSTANNNQYSNTKYYVLRRTFVTYSLQLLTVMLVYPLPSSDLTFLHKLDMIPTNEKPHNMVRTYLGRLHKENELNFIYSSIMSLLTRPIEQAVDKEANPFSVLKTSFVSSPTSTAVNGSQNGTFGSFPALSSWSTELVMLLWDLIQCNKNFKSFVYSKKSQELTVSLLYYIKFYRNNELWRTSLVRVVCFFLLYLSADALIVSKLLAPFNANYYVNKIPNFYKLSNQNVPSNLTYRDFLVIQISNMIVQDEFDPIISPNLFEYLYNLIPVKNNDPSIKGRTSLSYHSGLAVLNVINKMSQPGSLKDPLKLDLLAFIIRAIAQGTCRYHKESRTLLFLLVKHEKVLLNLLNLIQNTTEEPEEMTDGASTRDTATPVIGATTPVISSPPPESGSDQNDSTSDTEEDEGEDEDNIEFQKSLRPNPLIGMSSKAKSKLPVDAPLSITWAGYRALLIILKTVKLVKKEIPNFSEFPKSEIVEVLIKIENIENFEAKVSKFATAEFLARTKFDQLRFIWSSLSLGWYESVVWGIIFYENVSAYKEATSSSWFNKRNSAISLKGVATSWGFNWSSSNQEKADDFFDFDSTILQLSTWNGTAVKLFKIKKPVVERPLVDMNNLMKRLRLNSASSIATVESRTSLNGPRHSSQSNINSPNQLTPINSRQSFGTPRNSISHRDSVHLNLSRQSSHQAN